MYKKNIIELQIWEMEEEAVTPSSAKVFKGIQARGMAEIVVKSVTDRDGQVVREIQQHSVVVLWEG